MDAAPSVCTNPATDCGTPPACQAWSCGANQQCAAMGDPGQDGASCGTNMLCKSGQCIPANCGDGNLDPGEQCDWGMANGPDTGCEIDCQFSCATVNAACGGTDPCTGTGTCSAITGPTGGAGQRCTGQVMEANGTPCGTQQICIAGTCTMDTCGDGFVVAPEQCDDGTLNGSPGDGCTANCTYVCVNAMTDCGMPPACQKWTCSAGHTCAPVTDSTQNGMSCGTNLVCKAGQCVSASGTCGNGMRESGEQCDDGNVTNLDGCDSQCKFEQVHRVISMSLASAADTFCPKNAVGLAIVGSTAKNQLATAINNGIADGSITMIFSFLGLSDLLGVSDAAFQTGVIGGAPVTGAGYTGTSDLDWWYTSDPNTITSQRIAKQQLPASIAANALSAGPGEATFTVNFTGVIVAMDQFDAHMKATIGAATTPKTSSGTTPGHLATENLDPTLTSFGTMTAGEWCGNATAQSLVSVAVPSVLIGCNLTTCTQCYTSANTLLDLIVGGCTVLGSTQVKATQPDAARNPADTYRFTENSAHHIVSCTKNGVADTLPDCYANAGFSTLWKLTTDRVIAK